MILGQQRSGGIIIYVGIIVHYVVVSHMLHKV